MDDIPRNFLLSRNGKIFCLQLPNSSFCISVTYDNSKYSKCITTNQRYGHDYEAQAGCSADARCVGIMQGSVTKLEYYLCIGIRTSRVQQDFQDNF